MPALCVVTEEFVNLARSAAAYRGLPNVALLVLPHPFDTKPPEDVRRIAVEKVSEIVSRMTAGD